MTALEKNPTTTPEHAMAMQKSDRTANRTSQSSDPQQIQSMKEVPSISITNNRQTPMAQFEQVQNPPATAS
jgi:hypothetical protein